MSPGCLGEWAGLEGKARGQAILFWGDVLVWSAFPPLPLSGTLTSSHTPASSLPV